MDITEGVFETANRRGEEQKEKFPAAIAVRYDYPTAQVVISLASDEQIAFAPGDAQGLRDAQPDDLLDAEISPSGLGVHFPRIDADIYIPALLEAISGSGRSER
jgi:hypothetical protein